MDEEKDFTCPGHMNYEFELDVLRGLIDWLINDEQEYINF